MGVKPFGIFNKAGGRGNSGLFTFFTPGGLELYLDSRESVFSDGAGTVPALDGEEALHWDDLALASLAAGSKDVISTGIGESQGPTYRTAGAGTSPNGQPGLVFDGSGGSGNTQRMSSGTLSPMPDYSTAGSTFYVYARYRPTTVPPANFEFGVPYATDNIRPELYTYRDTAGKYGFRDVGASFSSLAGYADDGGAGSEPPLRTGVHLVTWRFNAGLVKQDLILDGESTIYQTGIAISLSYATPAAILIGNGISGNLPFNGDLFCVLWYRGASHDLATINRIKTLLEQAFGRIDT